MPSPSKDSRMIIDALEQPLHATIPDGEKHEYPALKPTSCRSTIAILRSQDRGQHQDHEQHQDLGQHQDHPGQLEAGAFAVPGTNSSFAKPLSAIATAAASSNKTNMPNTSELTSDRRRPYSESSYATANEGPAPPSTRKTAISTRHSLQPKGVSVRHSRSGANLNTVTRAASLQNKASSRSLVTPAHASNTQLRGFTDITEPRADAPTASHQSQEQITSPTNFSRPRPESDASILTPRSIGTASRIPIPDSKKATMIDVGKDRTSSASSNNSVAQPRFGSRRIGTPEALKILEQGKIRRQLQRSKRGESPSELQLHRTITSDSEGSAAATPSLSRSFDSPEGTLVANSPDPQPTAWQLYGQSQKSRESSEDDLKGAASTVRKQHTEASTEDIFADTLGAPLRAPPSTSPFTAPLQTITSEALLPTGGAGFQDAGMDEGIDARGRALSHLEGKGSPPKAGVDQHTLRHMFGHLKRGKETTDNSQSTFHQNAAAADMFLAINDHNAPASNAPAHPPPPRPTQDMTGYEHSRHAYYREAVAKGCVSKWSDTTPSSNAVSSSSDGHRDGSPTVEPSGPAIRRQPPKSTPSIGYPSSTPAEGLNMSDADAADIMNISSRRSSPTVPSVGKRKPGSVAAARQALHQNEVPSFARTTAASHSRMTTRLPTPTAKTSKTPEPVERGRTTTPSESRSNIKTQRSRSRSKLFLDKVGGLFHGKRDRKSQEIPPVPRIDERHLTRKEDRYPSTHNHSSFGPAQTSQLPRAPALPAPTYTTLRTVSPSIQTASDATLVAGTSPPNESQRIQDLARSLVDKSVVERNPNRRKRFLTFAQVLNDQLIHVREASISAEKAASAARDARAHYEMTVKGLETVERMAELSISPGASPPRRP
ncbi:uncharacterized protein LTR77_004041 [Saxophila tyrrhenica]|uniref:Uncharacterized protein n=1 Tax=Saxophila tyrrhenica TaxID=1690608 RepID=A0AAV9PBP0_9PEZI|nr:hypothetical protein LTR77_004041 [Saxophila tyrrhenica]